MRYLPQKALPVHPCPVCTQPTRGFWPVFTAKGQLVREGCRLCFAAQYRKDDPIEAANFLAQVEEFYLRTNPTDP
ncbi:hypothetical protein [Gloeobacter kilaueensis]|uniref:Uncharacterized protein n=1 Tax=Gloeobacter kilaueensis (strain ATCC BAA-2537 / CCAP 1431/1 / ULC 316 / JS1) TaxID=1183438 RepID=U5QGI0_GLOK1|nr:hypothetical protein [Gloeobacter kilaueensis]AGY56739.1 hypothetical protein GKIL_0493 [Gloeobacter kilaueensis JS1]